MAGSSEGEAESEEENRVFGREVRLVLEPRGLRGRGIFEVLDEEGEGF